MKASFRSQPRKKKDLILITNDDGFFSEGISALYRQLKKIAEVFIVAPDREKSASSLSLTLHRPLRVKKFKKTVYAVDGTPADCVYLAIQKLLPGKPSLLISGPNHGPNVGQQDISYSGTVAGAMQGAFLQIPALAVSVLPDDKGQYNFDFSCLFTSKLAEIILANGLPSGILLNINIPPPPVKGIKMAKLGQKHYNPEIIEKIDPRKNTYFWIGTGNPQAVGGKDSDVMVIKEGYITLTPIHNDLTDYKSLHSSFFKGLTSSISHEIS